MSQRGGERSYSTSFLINLDPDVLSLAAGPHQTAYDLCLNAMAGHTERIFRFIQAKSKRDIDQVFHSIYIKQETLLQKSSSILTYSSSFFSFALGLPMSN